MKQREHGFTLVELLVASVILVIVLGLLLSAFVQNSDLARMTQARNEVQDKVRVAMQLITQDLTLAGASRYVTNAGNVSTSVILNSCSLIACMATTNSSGGSAAKDSLTAQYITSLRPEASACRRVGYDFDGNTLRRNDVECSSTADTFQALVDNILALDIVFVCSEGTVVNAYPHASCPSGTTYPRSARVTVVGRSDAPVKSQQASTYQTISSQSVTCPQNYVCYALTQEVLMPNLKDQ